MIIRMVKKNIYHFPALWCYIAVSLILAYYAGRAVSLAHVTGMSLEEYVLYVLTDHYYLIYAWFFFLLYWIMQAAQQYYPVAQIRYGSYRNRYAVDNLTAIVQISLMILGNLLLVFVIGMIWIGPSRGFQTAAFASDVGGDLDVIRGYARFFSHPAVALFCVCLYWDMGCIFLYLILYYCNVIAGKVGMITGIVICVISTITGFLTQIDESGLNVLFFNNYYILHHALLLAGIQAVCLNVAVMIAGCIGLRGIALWQKRMPT